jgi:type II secretory pathway predicted ATPase ExeA
MSSQLEIFEYFDIKEVEGNLPTESARKLTNMIERTILDSRWVVIAGRIGSGKTTSVFDSIREVSKHHNVEVVELKIPDRKGIRVQHILNAFVYTLGKKYDGVEHARWQVDARTLQVERILMKMKARGVYPLLVIDEAQELQSGTFNVIKRLRDVTFMKKAVMLPVILIGQPNLIPLVDKNEEVADRVKPRHEFNYSYKELVQITTYLSGGLLNESESRTVVDGLTKKEFGEKVYPTALKLKSSIEDALERAYDIESEQLTIAHFQLPNTPKEMPKKQPREKISIDTTQVESTILNISEKAAS